MERQRRALKYPRASVRRRHRVTSGELGTGCGGGGVRVWAEVGVGDGKGGGGELQPRGDCSSGAGVIKQPPWRCEASGEHSGDWCDDGRGINCWNRYSK